MIIVPVLLVVALLAAGCATRGDAAAGPDLAGHSYRSTEVRGHTLVAGTGVTLTFTDGEVRASAGCNSMSGSATWDDGTLRVDANTLGTTEIGCDPERHAQDEWLAGFLTSRPALRLDGGTLTIGDDAAGMTLAEPADLPLVGTTWTLDGLIEGEAVSSVPTGVGAQLVIDQDGLLAVSAGCPLGTAEVSVDPAGDGTSGLLTTGPLMATGPDCLAPDTAESLAAAAHVRAVLDGVVEYRIEAETLTLTNGDRGLMFRGTAG